MIKRLICRLFGHAPLTTAGWRGGVGYARVDRAGIDGLNHGHLYLTAECPRCGDRYPICNVHARPEPRKESRR